MIVVKIHGRRKGRPCISSTLFQVVSEFTIYISDRAFSSLIYMSAEDMICDRKIKKSSFFYCALCRREYGNILYYNILCYMIGNL